jgi:arylsulfatase A-like enzyme
MDGPPGILVVDAPGVRAGYVAKGATVYDILPTLVASAGLPVARDLEGHALQEIWSVDSFPEVRWVNSYESGEHYVPEVSIGSDLNKEVQDELRELGYLDAEEQ